MPLLLLRRSISAEWPVRPLEIALPFQGLKHK